MRGTHSLAVALVLVPNLATASAVITVVPSAFSPNSSTQAQVCLVAANGSLPGKPTDQYVAVFDEPTISNFASDDTVRLLHGAVGITASHDSSNRAIQFQGSGTDMPQNSGACVPVTFTTGATTSFLVVYSSTNGSAPTPSVQPIAVMVLPVGPQGAQGPVGPQGPAGPQGQVGPQGTIGPQGATGATGSNGANGADGAPGQSVAASAEPSGANCSSGGVRLVSVSGIEYICDGLAGAEGPTGPQGPQGPIGPEGAPGTAGSPGSGGCTTSDSEMSLVVATALLFVRRRKRSSAR